MVIGDHDILILPDDAALDAADTDTADIIVVVDGGDEHLQLAVFVSLGRRHIFQNLIKQGAQIGAGYIRIERGRTRSARAEDHRAVQLLVVCVQLHEQLENLVLHLFDAGVRLVDLIDDDDDAMVQLQSTLQHEAGLGHRALGRVHQQQNAVDHLQDTLDLTAEVRVAGGIDDIDLHAVIVHRRILGQNRDAAFALEVARVHDALGGRLILAVDAALTEHLVHQRGLAVVNVRDDRNVSQIFSYHCL